MSSPAPAETAPKKFLRDEDIPYRWVQIADGSGSGLAEPRPTARVLAELAEGYSLVMVAPPVPHPPSAPGAPMLLRPPAAICRIVDTVAEAAAEAAAEAEAKAMALEAKKLAQKMKRLELNYAIAAHDLGHKVKRLNEFLNKGIRVEILLARKRGSRKTTPQEEEQLVRSVREAALAITGTTEYKKMDGEVGKVVTMFFEGPKPKKGKKNKKGEAEEVEEVEEVLEAVSKEVEEEVTVREAPTL